MPGWLHDARVKSWWKTGKGCQLKSIWKVAKNVLQNCQNNTLSHQRDPLIPWSTQKRRSCVKRHSWVCLCSYQNIFCDALWVFKGLNKHNKWPRVYPISPPQFIAQQWGQFLSHRRQWKATRATLIFFIKMLISPLILLLPTLYFTTRQINFGLFIWRH